MREFFILYTHPLAGSDRPAHEARRCRAIVAENLLLKKQLLVACRTRQRVTRLSPLDR